MVMAFTWVLVGRGCSRFLVRPLPSMAPTPAIRSSTIGVAETREELNLMWQAHYYLHRLRMRELEAEADRRASVGAPGRLERSADGGRSNPQPRSGPEPREPWR